MPAESVAPERLWRRRLYLAFAVALIAAVSTTIATAPRVEAALQTHADDFATSGYGGSTGSHPWAGPWIDGEDGDPAVGAITVEGEAHCTSNPCAIFGRGGAMTTTFDRAVDLSGVVAAELRFEYEVHRHGDGDGEVRFAVSDDGGGSWTPPLAVYPLATNTGQISESIDISDYASALTVIRFELVGSDDDSHFNLDNLLISATDDPPAAIVISEIDHSTDDFIELYNAGSVAVDIDGYVLLLDGPGTSDITITQGGGGVVVPPGGHYLLARALSGLDGVADQTFGFGFAGNTGFELRDTWDRVLDAVGLGTAPLFETAALPAMPGGGVLQSYERLNSGGLGNCIDTDDNRADFVHNFGLNNPQSLADPAVPCGLPVPANHVVISEFRPEGPNGGADEFVEIYNPTAAAVDVSGWKFHITEPGLFRDYHVVPVGVILAPGAHYLLSDDDGPSPNNAQPYDIPTDYSWTWGDVVLKDNLDAVVDVLGYGSIANGQMYEGTAQLAYEGGFTDRSLARRHGGITDTDDNLYDFVLAFDATPTMSNQAPVFDQDLLDRSDPEGTLVKFTATATDPNAGDTITYSATNLPEGVTIDPATGGVGGALGPDSAGVYAVAIVATDDGVPSKATTDVFTWTVSGGETHYLFAGLGGAAGGDDLVTAVDLGDLDPASNEMPIGKGTGTTQVQAATYNSVTGKVFAVDGDRIGSIDLTSGLLTPLPVPFGVGTGALGAVAFDNVTGVAVDPVTGAVYGVHVQSENVLFEVDIATGALKAGVFGGDDYVVVPEIGAAAGVITDLAFEPTTRNLYAIFTDGAAEWILGTVSTSDGASAAVGPTAADIHGLAFDAAGQLWGVTASAGSEQLYRINATSGVASDARTVDNGSDYEGMAFSVPPYTNGPPVFSQDLLDRIDAEGDTVSIASPATDPDVGDGLLYTATNLPTGVSIDPGSGLIAGTIDALAGSGSPYSVTVTVSDDGVPVMQDTDTFTWTITDVNRSPSLDPIVDPGGDELTLITFTASGSDPDLDGLLFSLSGEPSGATIGGATGVFTWTPTEAQDGAHTFDVILTDDGTPTLTDSQTITVTVDETNQPPSIVDPGNQTSGEGDTVNLPIVVSDSDDPVNSLIYGAVGLPPGVIIDPGSGVISGSVGALAASGSPYAVTITVTDDGTPNLQDQITISWAVTDTNRSPDLDPIADPFGDELTVITFTATGSDPDGDGVAFSLVGEPAGASIDPGTGVFTWTPTEVEDGVYSFDVVITDDGLPVLTDSQTITVTVDEVNLAPTLDVIANPVADELTAISFTATASDPDVPANTLAYSLVGEPAGASIDAGGAFSWTPTEAQDGAHTFDVVVTDDGLPPLSDSQTITVTVNEVNLPPSVTAPADQEDAEGATVSVSIGGSDPDTPVNALTYSALGLPPGLSLDPVSGEISGTVDPTAATGSPYTVIVGVRDDGVPSLQDTASLTWTISDVNRAPILDPVADLATDEYVEVTFTASASDPDGDPFTFSLLHEPSGAAIDPDTGLFTWTPTESQQGIHTFKVVVTDEGAPALDDKQYVTITVGEVNEAPTLEVPADRIDHEGDSISLPVPASDPDTPPDPLTWSATSLPPGLTIEPTTGTISGSLSYDASDGSPYVVAVKVVDGRGGECEHSFLWEVKNTNRAPVVATIAARAVDPGDAVTFVVRATDPDGDPVTYGLSGTIPSGATISSTTGAFTWTTVPTTPSGTYAFTATATDDSGALGQGAISIVVRAPNSVPFADDTQVVVDEDSSVVVVLSAGDEDGDELTWEITGPPSLGTLTGARERRTYRPEPNAFGTDSIVFSVSDADGATAIGMVSITVRPVNDPPKAFGERYAVPWTETLTVGAPGLLANDRDIDDPALGAELVEAPTHGSVELTTTGAFTYVPDEAFVGQDEFRYRVVDGAGAIDEARVVIAVGAPPAVSSPERRVAVDAINGFSWDAGAPLTSQANDDESAVEAVERTLVLMSRASGVAVQQMGFPFILLLAAGFAVLSLGRLRVIPLLGRRRRATGIVQTYSPEQGFGLVRADGEGQDVFVHRSSLRVRDRDRIRPGDRVKFRIVDGEHRDLATRVRPRD
jgi:cold shock CspA family protein